jgi:hypothetical protein
MPTFPMAADPAEDASRTVIKLWKKRVNKFVKWETMLSENLKMAYSLIYG